MGNIGGKGQKYREVGIQKEKPPKNVTYDIEVKHNIKIPKFIRAFKTRRDTTYNIPEEFSTIKKLNQAVQNTSKAKQDRIYDIPAGLGSAKNMMKKTNVKFKQDTYDIPAEHTAIGKITKKIKQDTFDVPAEHSAIRKNTKKINVKAKQDTYDVPAEHAAIGKITKKINVKVKQDTFDIPAEHAAIGKMIKKTNVVPDMPSRIEPKPEVTDNIPTQHSAIKKRINKTYDIPDAHFSKKEIRNNTYDISPQQHTSELGIAPLLPPLQSQIAKVELKDFGFHKVIGEGGFGKVYAATHMNSQQLVAVKVMEKTKKNMHAIKKERQILELTSGCPFLSSLYASFQTPSFTFLALEYLGGGDLSQYIKNHWPMSTDVMRFFCAEIACGLTVLHSKGIIHRDIKPENILLNNAGHIQIADFGLAVYGYQAGRVPGGTLGFTAPEMFTSQKYSYPVDWFSFGATAYNMATKKLIFNFKNLKQYAERVRTREPGYPGYLDPEVKDFLQQLLQKDPKKRLGVHRDIAAHPFFRTVDWKKILARTADPPFIMHHRPVDTSNPEFLHDNSSKNVNNIHLRKFTFVNEPLK